MITGIITATREAVIVLTVRGPEGHEETVDVVIDTGFDGWLSLPPSIVANLKLAWNRRGRAQLADGSTTIFDIFEGVVMWDGAARRIPVDEADTAPLLGMALLEGFELNMQVREGGKIKLKRLRKSG
jgi:clan AA aspartic protease